MGHYKSNLRDVEFNLFEVLGRDRILGVAPFDEIDSETARDALREVDRLAREDLAASFEISDREATIFDPEAHTVTLPAAYGASYKTWLDAQWWRLRTHPALGGTSAPSSLNWALGEFVLGANPTLWTYVGFPTATRVIFKHGTERDRAIAQHIVDRRWGNTMMLTEPEAGSDVGAGRTRATPNGDGTWNITGTKRFITSGGFNLTDNIVHLVLARPTGVEGAGGPGTKGLSLFLVPEHHFDLESGALTGERNGVFVTGVEKKMGVKVSATCEMTLGADVPARGWLLGDVHRGIVQMFDVIEDARMMVGTKAIATLSTGYLNALEYAKQRVQGPDLRQMADPSAPKVTISHHPDVRRSLLTQKAFSEGMRSLVLYTASWQDEIAVATAAEKDATLARAINDLLLPIVKGYGSERSWTILGTESLQTFGGSGYLQDFPLEQYVRDAKIDTVYEGTTAIQAQDLFFRKIARDRAGVLGHLLSEMADYCEVTSDQLTAERDQLSKASAALSALVERMIEDLSAGDVYKVGLATTRLLYVLGDVLVAWLLLRGASVALAALETPVSTADRTFYQGKVAAAQFFAHEILPTTVAQAGIVANLTAMELDEAAF